MEWTSQLSSVPSRTHRPVLTTNNLTVLVIWSVLCISSSYAQIMYPPHHSYELGGGGLPELIRVGGLFDEADATEETAFKHAVERVNNDHTILPRSRLSTQIERLTPGDSFLAAGKVCEMMSGGVAAIFGPQNSQSASHVQSICDAFELPHIEMRWDYKLRKDNYLINLFPHPKTLSRAFNDLVEAWNWEKYVIIYEDDESLSRLQDIIKESIPPRRQALLRQLPEEGDDYRPLLRDVLRSTNIRNIIIDCSSKIILNLLKQAQQVGLMTYEFSYIITSLDLQTIDLEDFKYGELNITSYRLVDPDKPEVQAVVREWNSLISANNNNNFNSRGTSNGYGSSYYTYGANGDQARKTPKNRRLKDQTEVQETMQMMTTETALIYDAVLLFSKALHVLDSSQRIDIRPLNCEASDMWQHGYSIINYMKMVQLQGLTGLIQFDTSGYRSDVQLEVVKLTPSGISKIGVWDSKFVTKFNWSKPDRDILEEQKDDTIPLKNRTLIVTTIRNDPFCMLKLSTKPLSGNDQYEGYSIDLLQVLSERLGFKYEIRLVADGKYGSEKDGEWNGMVKEVMDGVADVIIADLTVNKARQQAVDFTMPFMNLGISILHTKPKAKPPSLYSFLSPFSPDVWVYMCLAFFGVSLILFIIARITPYEWDCPHPCIEDPDELENQFTLLNSFWFTIGSLMQQGSDVAPKITPYQWVVSYRCSKGRSEPLYINDLSFCNALWVIMAGLFRQRSTIMPKATSTRMIAGIWWFFTLIMVSSYTANLATFLIVQDLEDTIKSVNDLPLQNKVKYGVVSGGSTAGFFEKSEFADRKLIWQKMQEMRPSPFVSSNQEGIDKVIAEDGKYAFFVESTVLEYNLERKCQLAQVGGLLDSKGYGVALKKGSKYLQPFSSAVLKLQEDGILDNLKRKWWKEERKEATCDAGASGSEVKPLALANVGGVFVVLVAGCIFAVIVAFTEFYFKTRSAAKSSGENVKEALCQELKFALAFSGDSKPVTKKKDSLTSEGQNENPMGSDPYLDLGMDSYGFPKPPLVSRSNGGIPRDGYT